MSILGQKFSGVAEVIVLLLTVSLAKVIGYNAIHEMMLRASAMLVGTLHFRTLRVLTMVKIAHSFLFIKMAFDK